MLKALSKVLIFTILFASFLAQAIANDASVFGKPALDFSTKENEQQERHLSIQTDTNKKQAISDDCCDVECCNTDCICIANACSFVVYLNMQLSETYPLLFGESVFFQPIKLTNSILSIVYRPPIITS